ncbi:MAG TPA: AbrB/MazE/SpoVT family DNA-binding domain-containing protein [Thermoanaerobaculia bacterium]|jgi:antitoxin MazE|nr:AbrB/MazE/SpoVT family DNA-binding domain-containing protein [Thermoanaerobaculia bacterium]
MKTRIQRCGDSLAVRIPKLFAAEVGLDQRSEVDVSVVEGTLVIKACPEPSLSLEELLAQVTDENLHEEVDTGPPVGREVW